MNVANSIIANNKEQLKKHVFSEKETGDKIKVMRAFSDNEEGKLVAEAIMQERSVRGAKNGTTLPFFTAPMPSRARWRRRCVKMGTPYKIYGGLSFYQRKEIKDLIAYFRLTFNPNDEEALKRVINYPRRGIGDTTVDRIILSADQHNISAFEVIIDPAKYLDGRSSGLRRQLRDDDPKFPGDHQNAVGL